MRGYKKYYNPDKKTFKRGHKSPLERRILAARKREIVEEEEGLLPLPLKYQLMLEDSWRDNEELYRSLR